MKENVTIYDIAARAKVSTTTVYKAMHNLKGISPARRQQILDIAGELGYQGNSIAQTLARKQLKIGVVFEALNQEFTTFIMDGVKTAYQQLKSYKVDMIFSETDENVNKARVLSSFEDMLASDVDGIILFPSVPYPEYERYNDAITERNIPVATVINEVPHLKSLTCVQYDGTLLGRMGGDLMNLVNPGGSSVVFIGNKDVVAQRLTIEGFRETVEKSGGALAASYENQFEEELNRLSIEAMVKTHPYVNGIFVGVSQSVGVVQKLTEMDMIDRFSVITVDTFPAIEQAMKSGQIVATLDRHPFLMGQMAVNAVYEYLTSGTVPKDRILLPSSVVLPANISRPPIDMELMQSHLV